MLDHVGSYSVVIVHFLYVIVPQSSHRSYLCAFGFLRGGSLSLPIFVYPGVYLFYMLANMKTTLALHFLRPYVLLFKIELGLVVWLVK